MPHLQQQNPIKDISRHAAIKLPLYCPKCGNETIVTVKNMEVTVIQRATLRRRADKS